MDAFNEWQRDNGLPVTETIDGNEVVVEARYGVTWATPNLSLGQTGYVFETVEEAREAATKGPMWAEANGHTVDSMDVPDWRPAYIVARPVYGRVETVSDSVIEVAVGSGRVVSS